MNNICNIKNVAIGEGKPKICVSVTGADDLEMLNQLDKILLHKDSDFVDVIEFRADFYRDINDSSKLNSLLGKFLSKLSKKVFLFTIRSSMEGGENNTLSYEDITRINLSVITNKLADMVDVEMFSGEELVKNQIEAARANGIKIIMSNHDFDKTPDKEEIVKRLTNMQLLGADIAKIAVMPQKTEDVFSLLQATMEMKDKETKTPLVTISMGKLGNISRVLGEVTGSAMTFAALEGGSAPGQMPISKVGEMLKVIDECYN
ncbi:MAG: type I 3-dehydroquinate dehydratase [Lachnospiraceae bacterium]|nr:type I 3-dehydroquinate dehydratase [Lachnospiraceae bacterium]